MNIRILFAFSALLSALANNVYAAHYTLPENSTDTVVTEFPDDVPLTRADKDETLLDVARRYSLGQTEILRLNPELDRWNVKKGEIVRISNKRILPDTPHDGITLNISEYRMYYYPPAIPGQPRQIMSYAHGVGRQDWKTPLGKTSVAKKVKDPSWHPPESIRREHAAMGDPLPEIVPPGPHNPLGAYALYLNLPGDYRIHGTDIDKIFGIGMQITHGCVRMYPEDVEELYNQVSVGTPVYIVKQPIKVGWLDNILYIEAHPDLEGEELTAVERYSLAMELIQKANNQVVPDINQAALDEALKNLTGDPIPLFERIPMPVEDIGSVNADDPLNSTAPLSQNVPEQQGTPIRANDPSALISPVPQVLPIKAPVKKQPEKKPSYPANNYYSPRAHGNSM
ncbi:MAG: L,D-transpeptidase family protein [Methylococcales bacterium]